jgi:hypothetical protein
MPVGFECTKWEGTGINRCRCQVRFDGIATPDELCELIKVHMAACHSDEKPVPSVPTA